MKCRVNPSVFTAALLMLLMASSVDALREPMVNDLRDAFTLLDASIRNYGDKLERHEARERQLGEILRRHLAGIDKSVRIAKATADERSKELERFLIQAEERERIQLQKAAERVEALGSLLETRLSRIESLLESSPKNEGEATETPCALLPKMETLEKRLDVLEVRITNEIKEASKSTGNINRLEESLNLNLDKSTKILEHLADAEKNKNQDSSLQKPSETAQLKDIMVQMTENLNSLSNLTEGAFHTEFDLIKEVKGMLLHIDQETKSGMEKNSELSIQKFNEIQNLTLTALEEVKKGKKGKEEEGAQSMDIILSYISSVRDEMKVLAGLIDANVKELQSVIWKVGSETQRVTNDMREEVMQKIADVITKLSPEPLLKTLTDMEHVMLQAADGVMDVGRRVEYSAARVIGELGEEIKSKSADFQSTIASRLDNLTASVLVNQTGAMETLSQRVESEISQVWRQIGIMYQQLTQSVGMLDKLQVQTEHYVNGSLKSMGTVQGRVGEIGQRVGEVEGNLNYLLGRLSLVSTEFNLVKAGLAEALDDVRRNMASVNNNIREAAPGTEYDHVNQVAPVEGE